MSRKEKKRPSAAAEPASGEVVGGSTPNPAQAPAWPDRVQIALEAGRLRDQPSSSAAVVAVWRKSAESAGDAALPGMSVDGSLRAAYDAGHMAALALLAAHGLRPGGGQGHHEMAFYGAAAFGYSGLENLVADSAEIRALRKGSMYDPVIAGPRERKLALRWMRETLPAIRAAIVAKYPALASQLAPFPDVPREGR